MSLSFTRQAIVWGFVGLLALASVAAMPDRADSQTQGPPPSQALTLSDFRIAKGGLDYWFLKGKVTGDTPGFITVYFGGIAAGESCGVDAKGEFNHVFYYKGLGGTVVAQAFNLAGDYSNIEYDYILL